MKKQKPAAALDNNDDDADADEEVSAELCPKHEDGRDLGGRNRKMHSSCFNQSWMKPH